MTLHFYWTHFETQKGPNYWYEQSFFVWCLLRQQNGGLNSGLKSVTIVTDALKEIGQGGPYLQETSSDQKATATKECIIMIKKLVLWSVVIFCSIPKSNILCIHRSQVSDKGPFGLLFTVACSSTINRITSTVNLDKINWCHMVFSALDLYFMLAWYRLGRNP